MATIVKFQRDNNVDYVNLDMVQRFDRGSSSKQDGKAWIALIFENTSHRFLVYSDEPQFQIILNWLEKNV